MAKNPPLPPLPGSGTAQRRGALPAVGMCRLRERPFAGMGVKKNLKKLLFGGWKMGWFEGIGKRRRKRCYRSAGRIRSKTPWQHRRRRGCSRPLSRWICARTGAGEERGCSEGRGARWGHVGDGVRAGGGGDSGRMRRLQCGRQLRA